MNIKFGDSSLNLKVDGSLANIDRGPRGYSAYEIAVQEGFVGTEEEWLASLVGPEGKQGKDGERGIQGPRGQQGDKGEKGDTGDTGNDGHTPVKGVDYFTSEDIANLNIPYSLSDLSDDSTHRTVTDAEKSAWNNKYDKPNSGIPATDLSSGVQASLSKADTALQEHQDLTDYVKNTDYATSSKGGVVKSGSYAMGISATGNLRAITRTYSDYENDSANTFIGKGTLENVITGKGLVNQDALVQSQEVQDTNIEENASNIDWLQTLVNQMPTVSDQGTDLSLQDVLNYRLMKFLPQGVSSQDGEPTPTTPVPVKSVIGENSLILQNENLFDISKVTRGYEINGDGSISTNTSYVVSDYIKVTPNQNYYLQKGSQGISNCFYDINKNFIQTISKNYGVITVPNNEKIVYMRFNYNKNSEENIMFVKGSTAPSTYVEHEEQNYPIYLGGNVFELSKATENVYINVNGTTGTSSASNLSGYTPVIGGLTYNLTYDYETLLSQGSRGYCFYDSNQNYLSGALYSPIGKTRQIVIPTNARYFRFAYDKNCTNISLATDMTPIELNSSPDGTIRDYIYGTPNNWHKKEYIRKVILNGSETGWSLAETNTNTYRFTNNSVIADALAKGNSSNYLMCNEFQKYTGNTGIGAIDSEGIAIRDTFNGFTIRLLRTRVSDLSSFKQWLSEHNCIVLYVRKEYTDIPITDTTLINQLNDIYNNAHSYNGVTNITTTYEDGNEQMYLDIEALAKGGSTTTETDPIFSASASSGITSSDISNWNNKADVEDIPDLTDYVKNTDYASSSKGGVIKTSISQSTYMQDGVLKVQSLRLDEYNSRGDFSFISKGTLETVITGKNLADKNYVDTAIATAITNTLGGSY